MKKHLFTGILAAFTCLYAASASAEPVKAPKRAPTAAKVKRVAGAKPASSKHHKTISYWMAKEPHVPLAVVDGPTFKAVGKGRKACGAHAVWAKPKSEWHAVDAFGQVTGTFLVKGSERYDVTGCEEVQFEKKSGRDGVGLFVSAGSAYKPPSSVAWAPSVAEQKRFGNFASVVQRLWVDKTGVHDKAVKKAKADPAEMAKHALFFSLPPDKSGADSRLGHADRPTRWAVSGGPVLIIAYLGAEGAWKVADVRANVGVDYSYKPIAVMDMNGDGVPEIVIHESEGPSFHDAIISLDPTKMVWEDKVQSRGGATL